MAAHLLKIITSITLGLVLFSSCDLVEFSPYEVPRLKEGELNLNAKNLEKIAATQNQHDTSFAFAVISDNHLEYNTLDQVVNMINGDKSLRFVIHLGDMTDTGTYNEYHWVNEKMEHLDIPYIMVIGNHDFLFNGKLVYQEMFGPTSFTFTYNNTKFVCFDGIFWEDNNTYPDFQWLDENLADHPLYNHVFVMAHIPPFADQYDQYCLNTYNSILASNNVRCTFHGHIHYSSFTQYWPNSETWYFTIGAIKNSPVYYRVEVSDTTFHIQPVTANG